MALLSGNRFWCWSAWCLVVALFAGCATKDPGVVTGLAGPSQVNPLFPAVEDAMTFATDQLHQLPAKEQSESAVDTSAQASLDEVYSIGPGDMLAFRSLDDETLDQPEVMVRYDGHISLPLVPDVEVGGLTRDEATEAVREAYKTIFRAPEVSLTITTASSKVYYVMGEVVRPAEYPYVRPLKVLDAINIAGGQRTHTRADETFVGSQGQLTKAFVIRHQHGGREVIECDLSNLIQSGPHASDTLLMPNDVVYVPEGLNLVYVIGEVGRSDVYRLVEGMTLTHLLARAGGPVQSTARLRDVVLMREIEENKTRVMVVNMRKVFRSGQDIRLVPGDVIYVPRKRLVRIEEFVGRFAGSISPLLSLYTQAYDAYYTRDSFDLLFEEETTTTPGTGLLTTLETLSTFGSLLGSIPVTTGTP